MRDLRRSPGCGAWLGRFCIAATLLLALCGCAAAPVDVPTGHTSITDTRIELPSWDQLAGVLTLRDYNTRVVVLGVTLLGAAAGLIGTFMLLRKRALLGDALSHATLPGIALAFLVMSAAGGSGKWLPGLLAGATVAGVLGVLCILGIAHATRIKEDAALGIVLSVFFGAGAVLMSLVQSSSTGYAAGLNSFIYGKTASMLWSDALTIALAAGTVALLCGLLFKEFTILCFDAAYARAQGWPVVVLDVAMMAIVVSVTVIGLQAVGLILMVALLVIPPAAARFWSYHLPTLILGAAAIGAVSGYIGAALSALIPRLPAGAIIVIVAGLMFVVSMLLGPQRGVVARWLSHRRLTRKVLRQHLLRALYELSEVQHPETAPNQAAFGDLLAERSWSAARLRGVLRELERDALVSRVAPERWQLTQGGTAAAWRVARNHRLWELFLISHADIAPSHVDRDADEVEHVLDRGMVDELEQLLRAEFPGLVAPPSPHRLRGALRTEAAR